MSFSDRPCRLPALNGKGTSSCFPASAGGVGGDDAAGAAFASANASVAAENDIVASASRRENAFMARLLLSGDDERGRILREVPRKARKPDRDGAMVLPTGAAS